MVQNKLKARLTFALFLLPALVLYFAFAIVPLFNGLWLSTRNWDGTAPWVPAQMPIAEFDRKIMDKVKNQGDREFILKYYLRDEAQGTYRKMELIGGDRDRMLRLFESLGFQNPDFHGVGIQNYLDLFAGKADPRFFPQSYPANRFKPGDPMDSGLSIPDSEFAINLLPHASQAEQDFLKSIYEKNGENWKLKDGFYAGSELDQQIFLSQVKGLENDWEDLYADVVALGEKGEAAGIEARLVEVPGVKNGTISRSDLDQIRPVLASAASYAGLKTLLAKTWYVTEHKMGVLLFTCFFVFFNVLAVNILALLLALALDQALKSKNVLRAVFYLPNVLSLIVVAFIWQLIFSQLLPAVTGIRQWMNNPEWAPWITVFVAVWQGLGYYIIVYHAGLQAIPGELLESAAIDGATSPRRFFRIVLPLLMPAVTICLFLSIAGSLKTFDIIFALYPGTSTSLGIDNIVVNIFYDAFRDKHASLATAKAVLLMLVIILVSGAQLLITRRKEVEL